MIKPEIVDDSAPAIGEGIEPDTNLTVTQLDMARLAKKEKAINDSVPFSNKVEDIMALHTVMFPELLKWRYQTKKILAGRERPRVLVRVLGYTGSGESSLINALIDEEMLVPANAMRANTSVVTEISWNDSDDPEKVFRAETEFISEMEGKEEMGILLDDLNNATKGEDVSVKSGSEASTAFAKISAVWPGVTLAKLKADIVRAIDDQVAKDLMGKSFRRQLLMDGKYDDKYLTFVMTKTDIINNEEVIESLQLREKELKGVLAREEEILEKIHNGEEALVRKTNKVKKIKNTFKSAYGE
ncbi:hypothetical protein EYC80_002753 [Monilinia laxa]|uniref:G domain-containing protein n=1 Tax=Monilinia laxa TaxID=61186 RepID=A0A5N6KBT6_MONLA|nr:hypothetical protein EYC80_002753 [Monilinia laxa]